MDLGRSTGLGCSQQIGVHCASSALPPSPPAGQPDRDPGETPWAMALVAGAKLPDDESDLIDIEKLMNEGSHC